MPEKIYGIEALKPNFDPERPTPVRSRSGRSRRTSGNRRGSGARESEPLATHATLALSSAVIVVFGLVAGLALLLQGQHLAALWTGLGATFVAAIGVWFGVRALVTGPSRRRAFMSVLICCVANPFVVTAALQWAESWLSGRN